ncbi:hypothetical protein GCM10022243_23850 [Saccharothrix violaceirubra]|uniref:Uncharacterized protein n=1 Tax=Saccharothrix violaceirubra TaxID=413306 RepID=A0A7W7T9S4_9PSEU|nr:hypothetical protein [Saccharothrix violaceirubra]MBB4967830.1 hypothetical protein [Saccharothrix violaceirubra]
MNWREVDGVELRERAQGLVDDYVAAIIRIGEETATAADWQRAAELAGGLITVHEDLAGYYRYMSGTLSDFVRHTGR